MRKFALTLAGAISVTGFGAMAQDAAPASLTEPAAESRTLIICLARAPLGLDPARRLTGSTPDLTNRAVFDTLVSPSKNGQTVEPKLARWWEMSPDGLQYTFRLRHGVTFHQTPVFEPTRPLAPEDVVYTFNRLITPGHSSLQGAEKGAIAGGSDFSKLVEGVEKLNDNEVRFTLRKPHSGFLQMLAMDFAGIISAEYGTKLSAAGQVWMLDTHPVGTGAFSVGDAKAFASANGPRRKPDFEVIQSDSGPVIRAFATIPPLTEAETRSHLSNITLAAHKGYWKGAPASDKLRLIVETDVAERYDLLNRGECHVMPDPAPADLPALAAGLETRVIETDSTDTLYLAFNAEKTPLDDKWVRRALAEAIDFEALPSQSGINGLPARAIVKRGSDAYPPERRTFNRTVARAHLDGAGVKALELTLLVPVAKTDGNTPLADTLKTAWETLGAKVSIQKTPWTGVPPALSSGRYDIALLAWRADSSDLAQNYETLLSCDAVGAANASRWCDKPFMADLAAVRSAKSPMDRAEALTRAARKVASDLPILSLMNLKRLWAVRAEVSGLGADALNALDLSKAVIIVPEPVADADIDPESGEAAGEGGAG